MDTEMHLFSYSDINFAHQPLTQAKVGVFFIPYEPEVWNS